MIKTKKIKKLQSCAQANYQAIRPTTWPTSCPNTLPTSSTTTWPTNCHTTNGSKQTSINIKSMQLAKQTFFKKKR